MKYKITNVVDYNGKPKPYRIGAIVTIEQMDIGRKGVFHYENEEMKIHNGFITSEIQFIQNTRKPGINKYLIETENSIYYLESYEE